MRARRESATATRVPLHRNGQPDAVGARRSDPADALSRFIEPGRSAYELSLALCAMSLVFPWLAVGALGTAVLALHRGSRRGWALLPCSVWCCIVGLGIRQYIGFGIFP
jgi:hypothetical protein